jgi:DNA-binding NarL/FixJ family response regulator
VALAGVPVTVDSSSSGNLPDLKRLGGKAIFLTVLGDQSLIEEVQKAGARGYVLKSSADQDLVDAIHTVLAGRSYASPALRH